MSHIGHKLYYLHTNSSPYIEHLRYTNRLFASPPSIKDRHSRWQADGINYITRYTAYICV